MGNAGTKIQIRETHLSAVQAFREARNAQAENREISDAAAVSFASWWQGSGRPGSVLAAFASGAETTVEELQEDLSWTIQLHYKEAVAADKLSLDMLGTYFLAKLREERDRRRAQMESASKVPSWIRDHIDRYFSASHGRDYVYRAPETFSAFEQWMQAVASGNEKLAGEKIANIENYFK